MENRLFGEKHKNTFFVQKVDVDGGGFQLCVGRPPSPIKLLWSRVPDHKHILYDFTLLSIRHRLEI